VGDGEKLLTYLNSVLKVLSGLDIFPRGTKKIEILLTSVIDASKIRCLLGKGGALLSTFESGVKRKSFGAVKGVEVSRIQEWCELLKEPVIALEIKTRLLTWEGHMT
jgi:hypothetical protein